MKQKLVSIVMVIILLQGLIYPVFAATSSELEQQKNNQKSEISDQKEEAEEKQEEVEDELDAQMQEIQTLDAKISATEGEISTLQAQLDTLGTEISAKEKEIEEKQAEYDKNQALSEERLVVMYEQGGTSFLDVLLSSSNIIEFLNNYFLLSELTECDLDLLESLEKEKTEIENAKAELENKKSEVETLKAEQQSKNASLKSQKSERETKVAALSDTQKSLQSEIDSYNAKLNEIDAAFAKAIAQAIKEEEEAKKEAANSGGSGNSGSAGSNGSSFDGTFIWPLDYSPRVVTSKMYFRGSRWHKGIDIGTNAETGKTVVAAASGTVIYSAYQSGSSSSPGYGNYLIIYHGNGYCSLYAHMNSKSVSTGQRVSQGQVIGYSGNTGGVAPHLHFEIRIATSVSNFFGNNWKDPLDYLPGGYVVR